MYPLKDWETLKRGFTFNQIYPSAFGVLAGKPHLGLDIMVKEGEFIFAPFDGTVVQFPNMKEGGNTIHFTCTTDKKYMMRFLHLSKFGASGNVKQGQIIGYTGNTGISSGPHLHLDISIDHLILDRLGNFVDPEKFLWDNEEMKTLHDFTVDGMPADERIEALKNQVREKNDIINSPTDGIAAKQRKIDELDGILVDKRKYIEKIESDLESANKKLDALTGASSKLAAILKIITS